MKDRRNYLIILVLAFLFAGVSLYTQSHAERVAGEAAIKKVYQTILDRYVAEIDPEKLSDAAIDGMLRELDPYSQHIMDGNSHRLDDITKGEYGGVGIHLGRMNDSLIVIAPMDGTPAHQQGIQAGDRIIKIDSVWTRELNLNEASRLVRGKQGSLLTLLIKREGEYEPIAFELERKIIKVPDIAYSGLLDAGTGYVKLSNFTRYSAEDLEQAIRKLNKTNLKSLIIDLRGNPGGLLSAALMSADLFIDNGLLLLETRGRVNQSNKKYHARRPPIVDPSIPVALLVNGGSASASEILSGILQDYDRGVVIGESTYGKGLVQTVTRLTPGTRLKLTTAKYYLPSGRLIQKRDIATDIIYDDQLEAQQDVYYSDNNRQFGAGGGVMPDVEVDELDLSSLERNLWRKRLFFKYALNYVQTHPGLTLPMHFEESQVDSFYNWMVSSNQFPKTGLYRWIESADKLVDSTSIVFSEMENIRAELKELEITRQKEEVEVNRLQLLSGLETEVASVIGGFGARVAASLNHDPVVQRAIELLESNKDVNEILAGNPASLVE